MEKTSFKLMLGDNWWKKGQMINNQLLIKTDPIPVYKNSILIRILRWLGLRKKEKIAGYTYTVEAIV